MTTAAKTRQPSQVHAHDSWHSSLRSCTQTLHGERGSLQRHQWVDYLDTLRDLVLPLELLLARSYVSSCAWKVRLWCPHRFESNNQSTMTLSAHPALRRDSSIFLFRRRPTRPDVCAQLIIDVERSEHPERSQGICCPCQAGRW